MRPPWGVPPRRLRLDPHPKSQRAPRRTRRCLHAVPRDKQNAIQPHLADALGAADLGRGLRRQVHHAVVVRGNDVGVVDGRRHGALQERRSLPAQVHPLTLRARPIQERARTDARTHAVSQARRVGAPVLRRLARAGGGRAARCALWAAELAPLGYCAQAKRRAAPRSSAARLRAAGGRERGARLAPRDAHAYRVAPGTFPVRLSRLPRPWCP